MTATTKDESLSRSIMVLCLGTALLLLASQGYSKSVGPSRALKSNPSPTSIVPEAGSEGSELVVDLSDRLVYVYQHGQRLRSYPIAVGQNGWETPVGSFWVQQKQKNPTWIHPITKEVIASGPGNPLGKRWVGFWSNGDTQIGFHGTNQEDLIGQAVSHGCIRMRNRDVEALYEQIPLGARVVVRP